MWIKRILLATSLVLLSVSVRAEEHWGLQKCIQYALTHSHRILMHDFNLKASEAERLQARGRFFPSVNMGLSRRELHNNSPNESNADYLNQEVESYYWQVSQTLFAGGYNFNFYQRSKLREKLAVLQRKQAELDLIFDVQRTYYTYLKALEIEKSARERVHRLNEHLEMVKAFLERGFSTRYHLLRTELEIALANQELVGAQNDVQVNYTALYSLLNLKDDASVDFVGDLRSLPLDYPEDLKAAWEYARTHRPDILIARNKVDIAEKDLRLKWAEFAPRVTLDFAYYDQSIDYEDPDYSDTERAYWNLGLNFSWNLFQGGQSYFAHKQAKNLLQVYKEELSNITRSAYTDLKTSFLMLKEIRKRINSARKARDEAIEALEIAQALYKRELATSVEVLDAQEKLTDAEVKLFSALADFQIVVARIYQQMGKGRMKDEG